MPITANRPVLVVLAAVTLTMSAPASASAATSHNGVCEAGEFCVYRDANTTGQLMDWSHTTDDRVYDDNTYPTTGAALNNSVSSLWNRSSCPVSIWQDAQFGDPGISIAPNERKNTKGTALGDNTASSHNACP